VKLPARSLARAVHLPAKSFDLALPGVAPPLVHKLQTFTAHHVYTVFTYTMLSGSRAQCPTARVTFTSSAGFVPVNRLINGAMAWSLRSARRLV